MEEQVEHWVPGFTTAQTENAKARIWTGLRSKRRFLLPLFAMVAVVLVACGSSASNDTGSSASASPTATPAAESESGDLAPDFTINVFQGQEAVGGDQVALSQLLGTQPIVLNFWAGLCPPCRAEMPDLQEFYDEFSDRVLLVGVDLGQFTGLGSQEDAEELLAELGVTYPAGFTNDANVIVDYRVLGMPSTIFIDGNGEIANSWTGALNTDVLREQAMELLNR